MERETLMTMTTKNCRNVRYELLVLVVPILLNTSFAQDTKSGVSSPSSDRPDYYSEGWDQFTIESIRVNPRLLFILRLGDGKRRNSEISILEIVDKGRKLRFLHKSKVLQNQYRPGFMIVSPDGRFLATVHEFAPTPKKKNDLVIYDLALGQHTSRSIDDFIPKNLIGDLPRNVFEFVLWSDFDSHFHTTSQVWYPSSPQSCLEQDLPFFKVDLLDRSIELIATPDSLPPGVFPYEPNAQLSWQWSKSDQNNLLWKTRGTIPKTLDVRIREDAVEEIRTYLPFSGTARYCLNTTSDTYELLQQADK